ncbi:MAG: hypothetical protein Q9161_000630 [Pseudevernia consocians]
MEGTRSVLEELGLVLENFTSLGKKQPTIGVKTLKAWKRLRWDQEAIKDFRSRIISNTTILEAFNSSLISRASQVMTENLATLETRVGSLQLRNHQHERLALLEWITPLNFPAQQSVVFSRRQEGTGQWLLESPEFETWRNRPRETLLCKGIPGAGKTVLASIAIDYLERAFRHKHIPVVYIYCDYRKQQEQTPTNLLASILKQLLQHRIPLPEIVMESYDRHVNSGTRPELEEIGTMLKILLAEFRQAYVIVDALDELPASHQVRQILLTNLRSLQKAHKINFMMTSRFIPQIDHELPASMFLEIRASNEDIKRYVYGHMSDLTTSAQNNSKLQEAIANTIVDVADGMFLLAQLHMDSLTDKTSSKAIKRALGRLPTGSEALNLAYSEAINRIEDQKPGFRYLAKRALSWITYACRLLTVTELRHALAIEVEVPEFDEENLDDVKDIVSVCCGLVTIDPETDAVSFAHYTTQEYFRKAGFQHFPNAQEDIAISCLTYLLFSDFGEGWVWNDTEEEGWVRDDTKGGFKYIASFPVESRLTKYPLLRYAARFWARHAEKCTTNSENRVGRLLLKFLTDDHKVSNVGQIIFRNPGRMGHEDFYFGFKVPPCTPSGTPMSGMHLAAYFNSTDCMSRLLEIESFAADVKDQDGRTPLMWAAREGHEAAVKLLVKRQDVDINKIDKNEKLGGYPRTALTCAAYYGHAGTVELLLEREDIDVKLRDNEDNRMTPLIWAAVGGYEATLKVLLNHKNIVKDNQMSQDDKALLWAAASGHAYYVKLLLERADVDTDMILALNFRATIRRHTRWGLISSRN